LDGLTITFIKVVSAEVRIWLAASQQVIADYQNRMTCCDQRFLLAPMGGDRFGGPFGKRCATFPAALQSPCSANDLPPFSKRCATLQPDIRPFDQPWRSLATRLSLSKYLSFKKWTEV
jgi:hypothetical protein